MESKETAAASASNSIQFAVPNGTVFGEQYTEEELREMVAALEEPFDARDIKWRITNTTADKRRGQMMAYADPRAYTDRLNALFTVRGWTREYSIETINNVERKTGNGSQIVGKLVVTCRVTIYGLGAHSGIGEEWADNENAGTAAEAQAFKRACSCFGLGRYLYDLEGGWVDLDERKQPKWKPKLPDWAIPKGKQASGSGRLSTNGLSQNRQPQKTDAGSNTSALRMRIKTLTEQVGSTLSRSVLMGIAQVENPAEIPPTLYAAVCSKLEDTFRGVKRLNAAAKIVGQQRCSELCRHLHLAGDALDDIPDRTRLRQLLEMVEKEATARTNSQNSVSANSSPAGGNNVVTMPNGAVGPAWQGVPAEVEAIWKRIVDRKSLCAVFAELHHDLVEVAGSGRGEALYNSILASRGVQRPEQFPNLGPARQTASALWKAIQDVANEAAVC